MASPRKRRAAHLIKELGLGELGAWLHAQHGSGLSYEQIARELYRLSDGGVDVSYQTIKNWLLEAQGAAA